jgi:hypothetical protein
VGEAEWLRCTCLTPKVPVNGKHGHRRNFCGAGTLRDRTSQQLTVSLHVTGAKTGLSLVKGGPRGDVAEHVASPFTQLPLGMNGKRGKRKGHKKATPKLEVMPFEREMAASATMAEDMEDSVGELEESLGFGAFSGNDPKEAASAPAGAESASSPAGDAAGADGAAGDSGVASTADADAATSEPAADADAASDVGAADAAGVAAAPAASAGGAAAGEASAAAGDSTAEWWENGDDDDNSVKSTSVAEVRESVNSTFHVPLIFTTDHVIMPDGALDKISEVLHYSLPLTSPVTAEMGVAENHRVCRAGWLQGAILTPSSLYPAFLDARVTAHTDWRWVYLTGYAKEG